MNFPVHLVGDCAGNDLCQCVVGATGSGWEVRCDRSQIIGDTLVVSVHMKVSICMLESSGI